jgi:hypothetical protein
LSFLNGSERGGRGGNRIIPRVRMKMVYFCILFLKIFLGIENPEEVFLHEYYAAIIRRLF